MKLSQQSLECRVALWLSLVIASLKWEGVRSVVLPMQWQPVQLQSNVSGNGLVTTRAKLNHFSNITPHGKGPPWSAHGRRANASKGTAFIQRRAYHSLRRQEPHNVEEMETIYGIPKIVWVILATVGAFATWISCIGAALWFARQPAARSREEVEREQMQAAQATYLSLKGNSDYNRTPTFFGGASSDPRFQADLNRMRSQLTV